MKSVRIDVAAGVIFVLVGTGFAIMALGYRMGTAAMMGPGYFPFGVSIVMAGLGAALLGRALFQDRRPEEIDLPSLKPALASLFWVLTAIVLFGLLLEPLGLVICIALVVLAASLANDDFSWAGVIARFLVLGAVCVGIFIYALGLQLPLWPSITAWGVF